MAFIAACGSEERLVSYTCDEPLAPYLEQARANIAKNYEVERSRQVLDICPGKGFHRRYTFRFERGALASRADVHATVDAAWCKESASRAVVADLRARPSSLVFSFNYPWSTSTGKYPPTEFRLDKSSMRGGFFEQMSWTCRVDSPDVADG
jgi:hypothetical protein